MAEYRTPGVYIEEISQSTPTAAQVATAIPIFIGYTEYARKGGANMVNTPVYINSLLEYREMFGGDFTPQRIDVILDKEKNIAKIDFEKQYYLFNSVRMFFANGGGQCAILSVGNYNEKISREKISAGIGIAKKENLPTIILLPDAVLLETKEECYGLQQEALLQCQKLKDRVIVLDVYDGYKKLDDLDDVITNFRTGIGINGLQFGAAYYPWIQTLYTTNISFKNVHFKDDKGKELQLEELVANPAPIVNLKSAIADLDAIRKFVKDPLKEGLTVKEKYGKADAKSLDKKPEILFHLAALKNLGAKLLELKDTVIKNQILRNELNQKTNKSSVFTALIQTAYSIDAAIAGAVFDPKKDFLDIDLNKVQPHADLAAIKEEPQQVAFAKPIIKSLFDNFEKLLAAILNDAVEIEDQFDKSVYENVGLYKTAVSRIYLESSKLPPSGAIAGIYSQVDDNRGVWKAPANVSLTNTVKPWVDIDNEQQENLNIDQVGGKSINAIRAFPGQGNLVWGARTLAGNDNDWRYISVRRFFNMAEKTLKQSSAWAVFEPNVEMTWIRIRAMMNNFLTNLWKAGALVGATPDEAFFVNVGLGTTMTQVDILEGKLIIEVGMAVVRPAEFIIIKFSHKAAGGAASAE